MANSGNSGTIYTGGHNQGRLFLKWTASQNATTNQTTVKWEAGINIYSAGYSFQGNAITLDKIIVAGQTVLNSTVKYSNYTGVCETTLRSGTVTINHNATTGNSGSLQFYIYGGLYWGSPTYKYYSATENHSFPQIPRAPIFTVTESNTTPGAVHCKFTSNLTLSNCSYQLHQSATASDALWKNWTYPNDLDFMFNTDSNGAALVAATTYYLHVKGTASASGLSSTTKVALTTKEASQLTTGTSAVITLGPSSGSSKNGTGNSSTTITYAITNAYSVNGQTCYLLVGSKKIASITNNGGTVTNGTTTLTKALTTGELYYLYNEAAITNYNNHSNTEKRVPATLVCEHCGKENRFSTQIAFTAANCGPTAIAGSYISLQETASEVTHLTMTGASSYSFATAPQMPVILGKSYISATVTKKANLMTTPANSGATLQKITICEQTRNYGDVTDNSTKFTTGKLLNTASITVVLEDNRGFKIEQTQSLRAMVHTPPIVQSVQVQRVTVPNDLTRETLVIKANGNITGYNFGNSSNLNECKMIVLQLKGQKTEWSWLDAWSFTNEADHLATDNSATAAASYNITDIFNITTPSGLSVGSSVSLPFNTDLNNGTTAKAWGTDTIQVAAGVTYDARLLIYDTYILEFNSNSAIGGMYGGDNTESPVVSSTLTLVGGGYLMTAKKNEGVCFGGLYQSTIGHPLQMAGMPVLGFVPDSDANNGKFGTT